MMIRRSIVVARGGGGVGLGEERIIEWGLGSIVEKKKILGKLIVSCG
jgi:hypothetical protein